MLARMAASACILFALVSTPVLAQEIDRIAAVVNDDIISMRELSSRAQMALVYAGIPDSMDARRRVAPQVLRKLIDEKLQMQEAARVKISLTPAEVDSGIAIIEQQNHLPRGALLGGLARAGINPDLVRDQIRADLTWMRVSARVLQSQVRVGDEEIKERLESLRERRGQPEYLLAEIVLPVDSPNQDDDARQTGERLLEQLQGGAQFNALARQFSRAPSAANGGTMGWLSPSALDEEVAGPVAQMSKGQVSPLIRTASGYTIVKMLESRLAGQVANPEDALVTLTRITLPTPKDAPPKPQLMARASQLTAPAKSCSDLEAIGRKVGAAVESVANKRVGEMDGAFRRLAASLPVNRVSEPLNVNDGIVVAMVCNRVESLSFSEPTPDQVRRQIEDERMDMLSRRYLRNLRRQAFVDIRG